MSANKFKKLVVFITIFILFSTIFYPVTISTNNRITSKKSDFEVSNNTSCNDGDGIQTKWAVLFACSGGLTYERHERRDRNDIRSLTRVLKKNGWDEEHILVLCEEDATKDALLYDSIDWLNEGDEDDLIFFFIECHGYYHTEDQSPFDEPDGVDEIIYPWDPDMAGWNLEVFVVDDELAESFNSLKSKNVFVVINTCHAGGFIDGDSDLRASGRVVITACKVDEASCMLLFPIHWLYSYYLVKGLSRKADKNDDNFVSAEEVYEYTIKPVQFRSQIYMWLTAGIKGQQNPVIFDGWPSIQDNEEQLTLIEL